MEINSSWNTEVFILGFSEEKKKKKKDTRIANYSDQYISPPINKYKLTNFFNKTFTLF